jgi:hypothetical protein
MRELAALGHCGAVRTPPVFFRRAAAQFEGDGRRFAPTISAEYGTVSAHHPFPDFPLFPVPQMEHVIHRNDLLAPRRSNSVSCVRQRSSRCRSLVSQHGSDSLVADAKLSKADKEGRRLLPARARIVDSCSNVSLRGRSRYRTGEQASCRDGHRWARAKRIRKSGPAIRRGAKTSSTQSRSPSSLRSQA